jgi:hypothetical protein
VAQCRVPIGCVFMGIVTESKTCRIYKAVLLTIKIAAHNLSGATQFSQHNTTNTGRRTFTPREGLNQSNSPCSSSRLVLHRCVFPDPHHKISDDKTSTEARQVGGSAQDLTGKIMAPWTFDVKFPCGT